MTEPPPKTPKQQKAHLYYLKNKERFIENAQRWREENPDKMKEYQANYFQSYKGTDRYYKRLEKRRDYDRALRAARPPKIKPPPLSQDNQPDPPPLFQLYRPPTPEPDPPQPTSFSVTFS
jgi:hypothetical protein